MKARHISAAEWEVMNLVWARSPISSAEIVDALAAKKSWRPRTIRTLVDRLARKAILAVDLTVKPQLYRPRVSREDCVRTESRSFLDRVFGGEPAALLLHLAKETELTATDLKKLKQILSEKKK